MSTILIIGAGASGMMAALTAAEQPDNHVILLERQARVGRKLLATGNGRCNLTNLHAGLPHYHGEQPAGSIPSRTAPTAYWTCCASPLRSAGTSTCAPA